ACLCTNLPAALLLLSRGADPNLFSLPSLSLSASTRNGILLQTALITKEGTEKERRKEEEESAEEEEGDGETPSLFDLPYLLRFAEEIEDRRSSVQFRKDISSSRSSSSSSSSACLSFREKTCLHIAAEKESIEMFYILLQHGADIDAVDSEGLRPEDQIANCIRHELASWIEKTERSRSRHDEEDREEGDGKEENSCFFPYEQKEEEAESSSSIVIDRECNIPRKKGKRRRIDALTSSSSSCGEEHEEEEETKEEDRKKLSFRQRRREEERNEAPSSSSPLYSDFPPGDILSVVTAGEDLLSRNERNLCLLSWLAGILEEEKETNFDIRRSGKKKKKSATICRDMKGRDDDYEKEENEEEEEEKSINFLEILSSDLQGPLVWPSVYPIETIDTCGRHLHITRKDEAEEERRKGLHGGDLFSHNKMPC
ncbi:ankyrin repeat-containing protein, partial [Cystoisospora suis]